MRVETQDSKVEVKDAKTNNKIIKSSLKSKSRIIHIQTALKKAGFHKGKIDGKIGSQTKNAIRAFQKSKGLKVDGIVGQKTWEELSKYLKD